MKGIYFMRVYAKHFFYNGKSSKTYGIKMVSFESSILVTSSMGELELSTAKSTQGTHWDYYGEDYSNPLKFKIQIVKENYQSFSQYEVREIYRWLLSTNNYTEFRFHEEVILDNVILYAKVTHLKTQSVGNEIIGFEIDFECNAPYGFSNKIKKIFNFDKDNNKQIIMNYSDKIGFIYPNLEIACLEDCDFELINLFEDRITKIKNCKKNEIIVVDTQTKQIKSSNELHDLCGDFNWNWFRLVSTFNNQKNILLCENNCKIQFDYQEIRAVDFED